MDREKQIEQAMVLLTEHEEAVLEGRRTWWFPYECECELGDACDPCKCGMPGHVCLTTIRNTTW
jgi:hypothetical protein